MGTGDRGTGSLLTTPGGSCTTTPCPALRCQNLSSRVLRRNCEFLVLSEGFTFLQCCTMTVRHCLSTGRNLFWGDLQESQEDSDQTWLPRDTTFPPLSNNLNSVCIQNQNHMYISHLAVVLGPPRLRTMGKYSGQSGPVALSTV